MRSILAAVLCLFASFATNLACGETFPYVAYVGDGLANIHAGPGKAHYVTDQLTPGTKVEVFRELSGWLAIKPPAGSFSWVAARDVELTDTPDVAQVLSEDVVAWIGSRVEKNADHVWQVQLQPGDQVQVLAVKRRPGKDGQAAETWYRIAPPPDEYRWIAKDAVTVDAGEELERTDAVELVEVDATAEDGKSSVLVKQMQKKFGEVANAVANLGSDEPIGSGVEKAQFVGRNRREPRVAAKDTPVKELSPKDLLPTSSSPFRVVDGSAAPATPKTDTPRVASLDRSLPRDPQTLLSSSGKFDDRLTEIELQLSMMAAKDPSEWQLDTLHAQAEQLVFSGQSTLERGRARLTLDKIAQFEALARKRMESPSAPRPTTLESVPGAPLPEKEEVTPVAGASAGAEGLKLPDGVTYDAVGWLKPVYSAKRIAPPYALVDADGKVLQYVTPAPGLNLNRYVKKPVGIFGQKSHLTEFKANHVTASRVVDLTKYQ